MAFDTSLDATRITTIVFDLDGTLYRQAPLRRAMLLRLGRGLLADPGSALPTLRAVRAYRRAQEALRGEPTLLPIARAQLRLAAEQSGVPEHVVERIVARWMEEEPLLVLERFVEPALRRLLGEARRRGLRLGVFSDYPAIAKLEAMRLAEFFDVVVTAQDEAVNRFKPDPRGLLEALRRLSATPAEALYVGDRHDVDAPAARAASVECIILGDRPRRAAQSPAVRTAVDAAALHAMLFSK
jgi:HAD superfamily hydrolase (TIGR01549 family)